MTSNLKRIIQVSEGIIPLYTYIHKENQEKLEGKFSSLPQL